MSKLFCDCKTDEEKSNFFLSGQGVETGIIAPAISNEVAMAFHRCFEFEKQLAAAIAACKLKHGALEGLIDTMDLRLDDDDLSLETRTAFEALTIQPYDSALKAWLGAPAGWVWERRYNNGGYSREVFQFESEALEMAEDGKNLPRQDTVTPLYSPKGLK